MKLTAYRADGTEVQRGDMLTSSRSGDSWRFLYATRPTTEDKSGKVLVNPAKYVNDGGTEVYANVLGLTVAGQEETPEQPGELTADDIITQVTQAPTAAAALAVVAGVHSRQLLLAAADLLYIDAAGHASAWLRKAIVAEART
jgi:hypothetical protein